MELEDRFGRTSIIEEESKYFVPLDDMFRNYRFILDPVKGVAEIFVNKIPVWKYRTGIDQSLRWDTEANGIMGKGITGAGSSRAVVDNFFIRATDEMNPLPLELFSFTAKTVEGKVELAWITGEESNVDHYVVERSFDAKEFKIIGMVAASSAALEFNNYKFEDYNPSEGLTFYRIRIRETNSQSTELSDQALSFPTIAYSYKKDLQEDDPKIVNSYNHVRK